MHINKKLELLSSTRITSGVSFESIIKLNKRYSSVFEKMTLGFECEIAVPEGHDNSYNEEDRDEGAIRESLRQGFENQFSFTQSEYLSSRNKDANILAGLFGIEAKYGFAQEKFEKPLKSLVRLADKIGFKVMGQTLSDGSIYMREPDDNGYITGNFHQFAYYNDDLYNVQLALNKAAEHKDLYVKFLQKYSIYRSKTNNTDRLYGALEDLSECIIDLTKLLTSSNASDIKRIIWLIGKHINKFKSYVNYLIKAIEAEGEDTTTWVVLNQEGECEVVSLEKWNEDGGILSSSLDFDQDAEFSEMYQEVYDSRYSEAFDEFVDEAVEESGTNGNSVGYIHNLVLEDVDENAKLAEGYHGAEQHKGKVTVVESDSSISPAGAEVVSKVFVGPKDGL